MHFARIRALTIDAEESARLDLTLEWLAAVCRSPRLEGWSGRGNPPLLAMRQERSPT